MSQYLGVATTVSRRGTIQKVGQVVNRIVGDELMGGCVNSPGKGSPRVPVRRDFTIEPESNMVARS